jgi:hypothetical protein
MLDLHPFDTAWRFENAVFRECERLAMQAANTCGQQILFGVCIDHEH